MFFGHMIDVQGEGYHGARCFADDIGESSDEVHRRLDRRAENNSLKG